MEKYKKSGGFISLLLIISLLIILVSGLVSYFFLKKSSITEFIANKSPLTKVSTNEAKITKESAKRTYFGNGQPIQVLEEESNRYPDGSLETVIKSGGEKLSQLLFIGNNIYRLSNSVLTLESFKLGESKPKSYLTSAEQLVKFIRQSPGIEKTLINNGGKKQIIYTIGSKKAIGLHIIDQVFAAEENSDTVKVYFDEKSGTLEKIEKVDPVSNQPQEVVEYTAAPSLNLDPSLNVSLKGINSQSSSSASVEEQLKIINEQMKHQQLSPSTPEATLIPTQTAVPSPVMAVLQEMGNEAKELKTIQLPPVVVPDQAIYINPQSTIPVGTSYNSPLLQLSSTLFNQEARIEKALRDNNSFNTIDFIRKNIKVRVDGSEISQASISFDSGNAGNPGKVTFLIPEGLAPGYHTVGVFMTGSWYLAPNLLVTLPMSNEGVVQMDLNFSVPPLAFRLPDNQGFTVTLTGKNFSKPLSVSVGKTLLNEDQVTISDSDKIVLKLPPSFQPGIYDLTITKGDQKIFRPSFLMVGDLPKSN